MNTCRQNRREAVTQSQGTLLQTTCRLAEDGGEANLRLVKKYARLQYSIVTDTIKKIEADYGFYKITA